MEFISAKCLKDKLDSTDLFILDIREQYERDICKIDSVHIPMDLVVSKISEIPSDVDIYLVCRSGRRAEVVANLLEKEYHFSKLVILEGGILSWIENIDNTLEIY